MTATSLTINDAIEEISRSKYFLPAIQREFVWSHGQIEVLFDSIMKGYPIGMFLFWSINNDNIKDYQFYKFIRNYNQFDMTHNEKANNNGDSDITAVLDGQQRLTSLYIGLKGSYAYKTPHKKWGNRSSFPERKLYLNLLSKDDSEDEFNYGFKFLTDEDVNSSDDAHLLFYVSEILNLNDSDAVIDYLDQFNLSQNKVAHRTLMKLYNVIHVNKLITPYIEKSTSLDRVLNIFIRVNSGGTQLSYSDLLLSIATAQWQEKDAREEITKFVDKICLIDHKYFNFDKDFVLKTCLVLYNDESSVAFKVDNFKRDNMLEIERKWDKITQALLLTVTLVSNFGYDKETLLSNNALIPIAYYIYKIDNPVKFCTSKDYHRDRQRIFKWLIMVLFRRVFSGQPDTTLRDMRKVIRDLHKDGFPIEELEGKSSSKSLAELDEADMDDIFHLQHNRPNTFSMLAFIYPQLKFMNEFHQDHIFPKKDFTRKNLQNLGYDEDKIDFYMENYNCIANLQLIVGTENLEKSGKDFSEWIQSKFPDTKSRKEYMEAHYIPEVNFSLDNFEEFITKRKELISAAFQKLISQKIA